MKTQVPTLLATTEQAAVQKFADWSDWTLTNTHYQRPPLGLVLTYALDHTAESAYLHLRFDQHEALTSLSVEETFEDEDPHTGRSTTWREYTQTLERAGSGSLLTVLMDLAAKL